RLRPPMRTLLPYTTLFRSERNTQATPSADASRLPELQSRLKDAEIDLRVERTNLVGIEDKIGSLRYAASGFASKEAALEAIQKRSEEHTSELQSRENLVCR